MRWSGTRTRSPRRSAPPPRPAAGRNRGPPPASGPPPARRRPRSGSASRRPAQGCRTGTPDRPGRPPRFRRRPCPSPRQRRRSAVRSPRPARAGCPAWRRAPRCRESPRRRPPDCCRRRGPAVARRVHPPPRPGRQARCRRPLRRSAAPGRPGAAWCTRRAEPAPAVLAWGGDPPGTPRWPRAPFLRHGALGLVRYPGQAACCAIAVRAGARPRAPGSAPWRRRTGRSAPPPPGCRRASPRPCR